MRDCEKIHNTIGRTEECEGRRETPPSLPQNPDAQAWGQPRPASREERGGRHTAEPHASRKTQFLPQGVRRAPRQATQMYALLHTPCAPRATVCAHPIQPREPRAPNNMRLSASHATNVQGRLPRAIKLPAALGANTPCATTRCRLLRRELPGRPQKTGSTSHGMDAGMVTLPSPCDTSNDDVVLRPAACGTTPLTAAPRCLDKHSHGGAPSSNSGTILSLRFSLRARRKP